MPLRLHDKPLYFDYSNRATKGGATGTADFLAQHTQWEPSALTKVKRLDTKVLQPGQHYKVGLELQMPTSYTNRRVGVFMVHTTLVDHEDNELASSARPAMLPHTSALRKGIGMVFSWPLHVAGLRQEVETVHVDCMDFYEENAAHPLTKAIVTVSSGRVQFYRASINITPELKGLPWLMRDWFYSTLAAGVLFIASLELMLFGFCYIFFFLGLEDPANSGKRREIQNRSGNDNTVQGAVGTATTNSYRRGAAAIIRQSGDGGGPERQLSDAGDGLIASAGTATMAGGGGGESRRDEGLRRRTRTGAATGSAMAEGPANGASSSTSWRTASLPPQSPSYSPDGRQRVASPAATTTLPSGVQAYQRGARYVVQESDPVGHVAGAGSGGGGVADGISDDAGRVRGSKMVGSGGVAGGGGSGGESVSPVLPENASQEEMDAAALASWAALDTGGGSSPNETWSAAGSGGGAGVGENENIVGQGGSRVVAEVQESASVDRSQAGVGYGGVGATGSKYGSSGSTPALVAVGFEEGGQGGGNGGVGKETGRAADVLGSSVDVGDDDRW
ncbi:unnamed protein product [Scytosiphon promiscuus]